MQTSTHLSIRWRPVPIKKLGAPLKPAEIGALATLAIQLRAESREDDIPLDEVAARTPLALERLRELAEGGRFPGAYFIEAEAGRIWYVPLSDLPSQGLLDCLQHKAKISANKLD